VEAISQAGTVNSESVQKLQSLVARFTVTSESVTGVAIKKDAVTVRGTGKETE
jgi:hypothetical protein